MRTTREAAPASDQSILGVKRALDVLNLFGSAAKPTLGVTEIAETLGLSKAVVHRILTALRVSGFVEMEASTHRYMFGPQVLVLGLSYLDRLDARAVAHDAMLELAKQTNETATFSVRVGYERVYIDQVTPERDVKMVVQLGKPFPLHTGASSKAMLASLSPAEQDDYFAHNKLVALTKNSITDRQSLREEIAAIRKCGYARSIGERDESAASVAAPIFGHSGLPVGVISVSGPRERFGPEMDEAAAALLKTVDGVSARLGYRKPPEADNDTDLRRSRRPAARPPVPSRRR